MGLFTLLLTFEIAAQGKLNFPRIDCYKNVTQFSYTPASGLTLSSASWDFGDGSSSNSNSPQYVYKKPGKYLVTLNANFTNGGNSTDTAYITIVPLPIANFYILNTSDTCLNNNILNLVDSSREAQTGQTIVNRLAVWGDGAFNNQAYPYRGQIFSHRYSLPDKYLVKIEITDKYGCKASKSQYINIIEQTEAKFGITNPFKDCNTKKICIINQSTGKNKSTAKYSWTLTNQPIDTNRNFNAQKCFEYTSSTNGSAKLKVTDANGCKDSLILNFNFIIDPLPGKLNLSDTDICYSSKTPDTAWISTKNYDKLNWLLDGKNTGVGSNNYFIFLAKNGGILPGKHTLTSQIIRGNCTTNLTRNLIVRGPIARMGVFTNDLCFSSRPVTVVDSSLFLNKSSAKYFWHIYDDSAPKCTTNRVKNENIGKNCIYSTDYYHDHKFIKKGSYKITLIVTDTSSGCVDSISSTINTRVCSPLIEIDTFNLCQGQIFGNINDKLNPKFVSLDSGKTWKKFPILPDKNLHGAIDVGFIFETKIQPWIEHVGPDSIRLRTDPLFQYDTIWKKPYLFIHSINSDSIRVYKYGRCKPFRITLKFASGKFYAGQNLDIEWGNNDQTNIYFQRDTTIDSFFYVYNSTSINALIKVKTSNKAGCSRDTLILYKAGKSLSLQTPVEYFCKPEVVCLNLKIIDFYTNSQWDASKLDQNVSIQFPDTTGLSPGSKRCHYFRSDGYNVFKIFVSDPYGCKDTLIDSIFVQNLKANVKVESRSVYCNELRQFFDSTTFIQYPGEGITEYNWDFGTGKFTNPVQNPFKSLVTSADEIDAVHIIKTRNGCVDTIRYKLKIVGSRPYFVIPDTIACGNLDAVFNNLSKNCSGYIWEFGDPDLNILPKNDTGYVRFNYIKPGRYHIKLVGYDSLYNPATNSKYFCNVVFPDPIFQKDTIRDVIVLPQGQTGILSPDTVCIGQEIEFKSLSDKFYDNDSWTYDNRYTIKEPQDTLHLTWYQSGQYTIGLWPKFTNPYYDKFCSDSAFKTIYVVGQTADFNIDLSSKLPYIKFNNLSVPLKANMLWHFDTTDNSPNSYSTEIHPVHNYGLGVKKYDVCLIATSDFGCADTTCKIFNADNLVDLLVFNVFTPGKVDGKNDRYDVLIKGEEKYHLRIYDRWGVLVFESFEDGDTESENNWNGLYMNNGPECPSGTYYYIFEYTLETSPEENHLINGTVNLIR